MDALQSLINYQYREDHTEEYDLLCKIMAETFKKINAMERQLQVSFSISVNVKSVVLYAICCIFHLINLFRL